MTKVDVKTKISSLLTHILKKRLRYVSNILPPPGKKVPKLQQPRRGWGGQILGVNSLQDSLGQVSAPLRARN